MPPFVDPILPCKKGLARNSIQYLVTITPDITYTAFAAARAAMSEGCGDRLLAAAMNSLKLRRRRRHSENPLPLPPPDVVLGSRNYCCYLFPEKPSSLKVKKSLRRGRSAGRSLPYFGIHRWVSWSS